MVYPVDNVTDANVFIADRPYLLKGVRAVYSVAAGGALTLDVKKCTGTTAPASGTTMLASTVNLNTTANTPITATLSATATNLAITTGDRIAFDYSSTIQSLAGCVVTLVLRPTTEVLT
jgi:hypothetical protein